MSAEPALDRASILQVACSVYGLALDSITFIPDGTAHAYRADGADGRYFVKVLPKTPYGALATSRVRAELPLLRALRRGDILTRVPCPVPAATGEDITHVEGYPLVMYRWIEATNLGADWEEALDELAPLLGRLHASTPELLSAVPGLPVPSEDFDLPFESQLLGNWQLLKSVRRATRPGVQALRDLLMPVEGEVFSLLTRARAFQTAARTHPQRKVVCHTDAHGGNVMRDQAGDLWIIDWETARLAPPEHDLWMLHACLPEVLSTYEAAAGGKVSLNEDILSFYFCRRALEDLAVDVNMILHENTQREQDENNLLVIEQYVLPSFYRLSDDLGQLQAALRAHR